LNNNSLKLELVAPVTEELKLGSKKESNEIQVLIDELYQSGDNLVSNSQTKEIQS